MDVLGHSYILLHRMLRYFSRTMMQSVLTLIGINLLFGFAVPGIDNAGHIGGLIGGDFFGNRYGTCSREKGITPSESSRDAHCASVCQHSAVLWSAPEREWCLVKEAGKQRENVEFLNKCA
ncbi:hypothetical protein GCM10020331_039610 [Ectobacillus funiculus]